MQRWSDIMDEDEHDDFCHIPCVGDEVRLVDRPSRYRVLRVIGKRQTAVVVDIYRPDVRMRVPFEQIQKN